jgi:signal transduction histidine kinase
MLPKVAELFQQHVADLGAFLTRHEKGRQLPGYLAQLAGCLREEQAALLREAGTLTQNLTLVRNVIALQQNYARVAETVETVPLRDVAEDALFIHTASDSWSHIEIVRDYRDLTPVTINRQQVLHLLFNLLQNAQHACDEAATTPKRITLRTSRGEDQSVILKVTDNGIGIPPGNLDKLFTYGFTTRENGQGFGLHNAAQSARQMGGSLAAHSEGIGRGATFTLALPLKPPPPSAQ